MSFVTYANLIKQIVKYPIKKFSIILNLKLRYKILLLCWKINKGFKGISYAEKGGKNGENIYQTSLFYYRSHRALKS